MAQRAKENEENKMKETEEMKNEEETKRTKNGTSLPWPALVVFTFSTLKKYKTEIDDDHNKYTWSEALDQYNYHPESPSYQKSYSPEVSPSPPSLSDELWTIICDCEWEIKEIEKQLNKKKQ